MVYCLSWVIVWILGIKKVLTDMTVSYNGLWKILIDKGLQKQDLVNKAGLSSATVAKMGKGEPVSNKVLEKLANFLECNISEIISYE